MIPSRITQVYSLLRLTCCLMHTGWKNLIPIAYQTEIVVDLANVETCTLYEEYGLFSMSDKKDAKADPVLAKMGLKIEFSSSAPFLPHEFYNNHVNGIYQMQELEKKAKERESLVAQKASREIRHRA